MARKYFCAYHSYLTGMEELSDTEVGRLFRALLKYSETGERSNLRGAEKVLFPMMAQQIDRERDSYDSVSQARAEAGKKGGRPKKQEEAKKPNAFFEKQKKLKEEEREEEKEEKKEVVVIDDTTKTIRLFTDNTSIRNLTPAVAKAITDWCEIAGCDLVQYAITYCVKNKGRDVSWGYIEKPLKEWHEAGLKAEDVDQYISRFKANKSVKENFATQYSGQRQYAPGELESLFEDF